MVNGHIEQDVNPGPKRSRQAFTVEDKVYGLVRLGYWKAKLGWEERFGERVEYLDAEEVSDEGENLYLLRSNYLIRLACNSFKNRASKSHQIQCTPSLLHLLPPHASVPQGTTPQSTAPYIIRRSHCDV
jgi:hypothetical protein